MRRIVVVLLLLAALPSRGAGQEVRKAPTLILRDLQGRNLRLKDYKGKVVLLNFWATWCPPCRAEVPELVKWQREYRGRGLQIIGVTYPPQTTKEVRRFVRKLKINYPVALGTKQAKALFFQGETLPLTVIIDREGNVRDLIEGILLPEEFEQKIQPLLRSTGRTTALEKHGRIRRLRHNLGAPARGNAAPNFSPDVSPPSSRRSCDL